MTALNDLKNLIDRELGMTGWECHILPRGMPGGWCSPEQSVYLKTQRGMIPASTLKLLVEMIPGVVSRYAADIERAKDEAYEQALHDYGHRFE